MYELVALLEFDWLPKFKKFASTYNVPYYYLHEMTFVEKALKAFNESKDKDSDS